MSRANPQFNKDALPGLLAAFEISHQHIAGLGGLRGRTRTVHSAASGCG